MFSRLERSATATITLESLLRYAPQDAPATGARARRRGALRTQRAGRASTAWSRDPRRRGAGDAGRQPAQPRLQAKATLGTAHAQIEASRELRAADPLRQLRLKAGIDPAVRRRCAQRRVRRGEPSPLPRAKACSPARSASPTPAGRDGRRRDCPEALSAQLGLEARRARPTPSNSASPAAASSPVAARPACAARSDRFRRASGRVADRPVRRCARTRRHRHARARRPPAASDRRRPGGCRGRRAAARRRGWPSWWARRASTPTPALSVVPARAT